MSAIDTEARYVIGKIIALMRLSTYADEYREIEELARKEFAKGGATGPERMLRSASFDENETVCDWTPSRFKSADAEPLACGPNCERDRAAPAKLVCGEKAYLQPPQSDDAKLCEHLRVDPKVHDNILAKAANRIEQLSTDVARLEATARRPTQDYVDSIARLTTERDAAIAKADRGYAKAEKFELDWMEAKYEFGTAMAKASEKIRAAEKERDDAQKAKEAEHVRAVAAEELCSARHSVITNLEGEIASMREKASDAR